MKLYKKGIGNALIADDGLSPTHDTYPLHAVDDEGALAWLTARGTRQRAILQSTHSSISQIGTIAYVLINSWRTETQCLLQAIGTSTGGNFSTLDEYKVHSDGTCHGLRLIGAWLQWQQLCRCWSHRQFINAHQTETQKLGRIRCNYWTVIDLKENFGRLWGEFAVKGGA